VTSTSWLDFGGDLYPNADAGIFKRNFTVEASNSTNFCWNSRSCQWIHINLLRGGKYVSLATNRFWCWSRCINF